MQARRNGTAKANQKDRGCKKSPSSADGKKKSKRKEKPQRLPNTTPGRCWRARQTRQKDDVGGKKNAPFGKNRLSAEDGSKNKGQKPKKSGKCRRKEGSVNQKKRHCTTNKHGLNLDG